MMLASLARRSLAATSRSYFIARSLSVAVKVKPPVIANYLRVHPHVKPISAPCFRLITDSKGASGEKFCIMLNIRTK